MAKKGLLESIVSGVLGEGSASTGDFLDTIEDALSDLVGSDAASDGLLEGIGSLSNGMNTLTENLPSLTDGVQQLLDGANELKDGLNTFDEEGVSKLVSLVEDDLADMLDRVKAALNAANAYTTYTSLGENMTGRVRFVWRTDANQK